MAEFRNRIGERIHVELSDGSDVPGTVVIALAEGVIHLEPDVAVAVAAAVRADAEQLLEAKRAADRSARSKRAAATRRANKAEQASGVTS